LASTYWTASQIRRNSTGSTYPSASDFCSQAQQIELRDIAPSALGKIPRNVQVVTVCDLVHEELHAPRDWWHWSIPDPVPGGNPKAFDAVIAELEGRVNQVINSTVTEKGVKS